MKLVQFKTFNDSACPRSSTAFAYLHHDSLRRQLNFEYQYYVGNRAAHSLDMIIEIRPRLDLFIAITVPK